MPMHCMDCKQEIKKGEKTRVILKRGKRTVCESCYSEYQFEQAEADEFDRQCRRAFEHDPEEAERQGL